MAAAETLVRALWMPRSLNWWIGVVFAAGSSLFALASVLSLRPGLATAWSLDSTGVNAVFFAGSIPFTTAAWLQLYQAANPVGNGSSAGSRKLFGWRPRDIGWLSCALQFAGTILFNFNTADAMSSSLTWFEQDLVVWAPDIVGSVLFLASGYLALIETCHARWAWQPSSVSWWVVFVNLLGCMGFMASALFAFVTSVPRGDAVTISLLFTLIGAIGFLVGSLLMMVESAAYASHRGIEPV